MPRGKPTYRIEIRVYEREYNEIMELRGDRTCRALFLEALGIEEEKRIIGRPKK